MSEALYRIAKKSAKHEGFSSVPCYVRALLIENKPTTIRDLSPAARKFINGMRRAFETSAGKHER